jgi:hypothetical protein
MQKYSGGLGPIQDQCRVLAFKVFFVAALGYFLALRAGSPGSSTSSVSVSLPAAAAVSTKNTAMVYFHKND